jgi:hypothetical protein
VAAFTKKAMTCWRARMCLHTENELIETEDIKIQREIFQADSLSSLVFCVCLIPLMEHLNRWNIEMTQQLMSNTSYINTLGCLQSND